MSNLALVQQSGSSLTKATMPPGMVITSLQDAITIGKILAASKFFKDATTDAQAVAKILRGWELGIPPVAALENIYVIDGKTSLSAHLIAAKIEDSGRFRQRIIAHTNEICAIRFDGRTEGSWDEIGISEFTIADAKIAKLIGKNNWQQYPKAMLYSRALAQGARWFCSRVFMGAIYVPEELGVETDESGNAVEEAIAPVVFKSNSEQIGDVLDELGLTDPATRRQTAQQHLAGRKAADLSQEELDAVLTAIRQSASPAIPVVSEVVASVVAPVAVSTPVVVPTPAPVVAPTTVVTHPDRVDVVLPINEEEIDVSNGRALISNLLDQLGVQDAVQRQQLVKKYLGRRKVENLDAFELQAVLNGIRQSASVPV
jgi:hypothetical protein